MNTKLIILNTDGVILDKELALANAITTIIKNKFKINISAKEYQQSYLYTPKDQVLKRLQSKAPKMKDSICIDEILKEANHNYSGSLNATENITQVLQTLEKNGVIIAAYTINRENYFKELLKQQNLQEYITHFVCSENEDNLFKAISNLCDKINVVTKEVTIVSSNTEDIEHFNNFNVKCIGYSKNSNARVKFKMAGANLDLKIIERLPLVI